MKLGLKALVIALVMVLLAAPAAFAKNGGGQGGHGKPSWAGQGKPSWAGSGRANGKAHHEQKAKKPKHHGVDAATDEESGDDVDLDGLNPAWYCKTLSDEVTKLAQDFASMFGTNPNGANAFGKCVSQRAHELNGSNAAGGGAEQESCETNEPPATESTQSGGEDAESSDDEATGPEECESADSGSDAPAGDEQEQGDDEQGEEDQGQDEGDASDELDSSDLAAALRFLRL
jgi:hypothetical protein